NRVWFTSSQFKRQRDFATQLLIAPTDLADRLEALTRAEPRVAIRVLESLVAEAQAILAEHMPDFDPTLRRGPGTRETPGRVRESRGGAWRKRLPKAGRRLRSVGAAVCRRARRDRRGVVAGASPPALVERPLRRCGTLSRCESMPGASSDGTQSRRPC